MKTSLNHSCFRAAILVMLVVVVFMGIISPSMQQGQQQGASSPVLPALIVFGDSTVDVGMNNNLTTVIRANFRPYGRNFINGQPTGRFCNGRVPVDFVATSLGLPFPLAYFDPNANGQNIVQGINFASSASGYNDNTAKFFNVLSLTKQIGFFQSYRNQLAGVVGTDQAASIISEALYVLSTGSNDFANNYFFNVRLQGKFTMPQYIEFLLQNAATFLENLYQLGARKLGVVSVPILGCLPAQRSVRNPTNFTGCVDSENEVAMTFNSGLSNLIGSFRAKYTDYKILYLDCFAPLLDIYQNPSKYGIEEVARGCCATGTVETAVLCDRFDSQLSCPDATKYMFWDSYHPTETVYKILADQFYNELLGSDLL